MLINVKMSIIDNAFNIKMSKNDHAYICLKSNNWIVGILTFISMINFILSWDEHKKVV